MSSPLAVAADSSVLTPTGSGEEVALGSWSALGEGVFKSGFSLSVLSTLLLDDDTLYAGGDFDNASGVANTKGIAAWADDTWQAMGVGVNLGTVFGLTASNDSLYAVGTFTGMSGVPDTSRLAQWSDDTWISIGSAGSSVLATTSTDDTLYIGGYPREVAGVAVNRVAQYADGTWSPMGAGMATTPNGVRAMTAVGDTVYVGGSFTGAGGLAAGKSIAAWDGSSWSAFGAGIGDGSSQVNGIAVVGDEIYAGGNFANASEVPDTKRFAVWRDDTWNSVPGALNQPVYALAADTDHDLVYVGGGMTSIGTQTFSYVAVWDIGLNEWIPFQSASTNGVGSLVTAFAVDGADVYVGGPFTDAGGIAAADRVAKWTWAPPAGSNTVSGEIGDLITITGSGFIGVPATGAVLLGSTPTTYIRDDSTSITFTVPADVSLGDSAITIDAVGGAGVVGSFTRVAPPGPTPVPPPTPPAAPRDVEAEGGDGSAVVSWSPPAQSGSFPVTNYQVTATPGASSCLVAAEQTSCDITGLVNGTGYTLSARALSGAGWSAWSTPSASVTPQREIRPTIQISGSRGSGASGRTVTVSGATTDLIGATVQARVRLPGQVGYRAGSTRVVDDQGAFIWQRRANKRVYVYFANDDTRSNRVIIPAR